MTTIVGTALEMAEAEGIDGLSLRRLADRLGVRAPALYWHIPGKRALLDEMVDVIVRPAVPIWNSAPVYGWDAWLMGAARAMRAALRAHRGGPAIAVGAGLDRAVNLGVFIERTVAVLHDQLSIDLGAATRLAGGFNAFVLGRIAEESAVPTLDEATVTALRGRFPLLAEGLSMRAAQGYAVGGDEDFDLLVRIWIEGIRAVFVVG
ncbi:transcriptional regulator, TetR family [Williamsia sterculiae]|uniref:Transcriptional regulator, TetR family n=2 Tax=Williamsia sterculiae TaxID=1344003 RepID=A0A1N7EZQ7_9NOCA|nr:transcriptional regulator, TetR family [Williamsia sterculiae]